MLPLRSFVARPPIPQPVAHLAPGRVSQRRKGAVQELRSSGACRNERFFAISTPTSRGRCLSPSQRMVVEILSPTGSQAVPVSFPFPPLR